MMQQRDISNQPLRLRAQAALLAGLLAASGWAGAATKSATFLVTLTIENTCDISANPLNFGAHGALTSNIDQSTDLTLTCSGSTPYTVALDAGTTTGSTVPARLLAGPEGATVAYQLFRDSTRTQVWGNTVGLEHAGTGTGAAQTVPVFGRVPVQATPAPGVYASNVTATVTF